jgi:hypothetical protein
MLCVATTVTDEDPPLPPPFILGGMYEDEISKYKVISLEGSRMTFERLDGTQAYTDNIPLKASIHRRRVREQQRPSAISYREMKTAGGTSPSEYKYEVVIPLVAGIIDKHSECSAQWLAHARLKQGLLGDPHARSIIDRLPRTDTLRTSDAWAGVIIAGFSKEWTEGRWPRFDRKKIGKGHAWRVKD